MKIVLVILAVATFAALLAFIFAQKKNEYPKEGRNKWIKYALIAFGIEILSGFAGLLLGKLIQDPPEASSGTQVVISPTTAPSESQSTETPEPQPTETSESDSIATSESQPTTEPTLAPTLLPTPYPTAAPTPYPTAEPTPYPTAEPTPYPTAEPTPYPTAEPTPYPTAEPTPYPTAEPTPYPTAEPTPYPTVEPPVSSAGAFTVSVSYGINPIQVSSSGVDVLVTAHTSYPATSVTISSSTGSESYGPFNMYQGTDGWWFNANFYERGTFTVLITAYFSDGQSATDSFEYTY